MREPEEASLIEGGAPKGQREAEETAPAFPFISGYVMLYSI
jgi:hypothetical protein